MSIVRISKHISPQKSYLISHSASTAMFHGVSLKKALFQERRGVLHKDVEHRTMLWKHHGTEYCVENDHEASQHDYQSETSLTISYVNYVNERLY